MASSVNRPTDNNHLVFVVKHALGCGTVAGIYAEQVAHIYEVVGLSALSMVYLFALLAFYFILYGYEARFIRFIQDSYRRRLQFFKVSVLVLNVLFSFNVCLRVSVVHYSDLAAAGLQGIFSLVAVLFPELLLPLIFAIEDAGGR